MQTWIWRRSLRQAVTLDGTSSGSQRSVAGTISYEEDRAGGREGEERTELDEKGLVEDETLPRAAVDLVRPLAAIARRARPERVQDDAVGVPLRRHAPLEQRLRPLVVLVLGLARRAVRRRRRRQGVPDRRVVVRRSRRVDEGWLGASKGRCRGAREVEASEGRREEVVALARAWGGLARARWACVTDGAGGRRRARSHRCECERASAARRGEKEQSEGRQADRRRLARRVRPRNVRRLEPLSQTALDRVLLLAHERIQYGRANETRRGTSRCAGTTRPSTRRRPASPTSHRLGRPTDPCRRARRTSCGPAGAARGSASRAARMGPSERTTRSSSRGR